MALSIARRVELLEEKVDSLAQLPVRVSALESVVVELRDEVRGLRGELGTQRDDLRREIREGDEETRRQMRVLHEDVIARLALLQEGINGRTARHRPAKRKKR